MSMLCQFHVWGRKKDHWRSDPNIEMSINPSLVRIAPRLRPRENPSAAPRQFFGASATADIFVILVRVAQFSRCFLAIQM